MGRQRHNQGMGIVFLICCMLTHNYVVHVNTHVLIMVLKILICTMSWALNPYIWLVAACTT